MATNKNAQLRYQVLDKCFRNPGRHYYIEDLIKVCSEALQEFNGGESRVSRRQIFNDINFMRSEAGWSAPIEQVRVGRRVYYRYEDRDFSINNQPLNETDINNLQSAIQVLAKLEGLPQLDLVQELLGKLTIGSTVQDFNPVVSFGENPYLQGREFFGQFFNAITHQRVLQVSYQDFNSPEPYAITFHPHHLKQYNNRWFVFGYNEEREQHAWNMALDRVKAITELPSSGFVSTSINWNEYFEDIIGVSRNADLDVMAITLLVSPYSAPYVLTKPLHGSQKRLELSEEGVKIELRLVPNYEFYQRILGFGSAIKVLSPDWVAAEVADRIRAAVAHYETN